MNKSITLKEVAKLAGVDTSTASRVLSGQTTVKVRKRTREKVHTAAKELNFRPNVMAKSLRESQSSTLVLIIPDVGNPHYPEIVRGAIAAANELGYTIFLSTVDHMSIKQKLHLKLLQERRVDGLILAAFEDDMIRDLQEANLPFVLLNRHMPGLANCIIADDTAAAVMAVEHLIDLGHRDIAHLSGMLNNDLALRRFQGYRKAIEQNGLRYNKELVEECDWTKWGHGKMAANRLLAKGQRPSAIFASNLVIALGAFSAIAQAGLKIPEDISLICVQDAPLAEILEPPITVVKMPLYQIAHIAVTAMVELLRKGNTIQPVILAPCGLMVRKSTCPPKKIH